MADSSDDTTDLCILAGIYGTQIKRRFTHLFCDTCCAGLRAGKFRNGHQVELRVQRHARWPVQGGNHRRGM